MNGTKNYSETRLKLYEYDKFSSSDSDTKEEFYRTIEKKNKKNEKKNRERKRIIISGKNG